MEDEFWDDSQNTGFDFESGGQTSMCGISLNGTTVLSEQIKQGLNTLAPAFDSTLFDSFKIEDATNKPRLGTFFSEKVLNAIFDADNPTPSFIDTSSISEQEEIKNLKRQLQSRWVPPSIDRSIKDAFLGLPHSFELYKSFLHKQQLLKAAEKLGDGNVILEVVIFLSQTLKQTLFYRILRSSPLATQHYVNYLSNKNIDECENVLVMSGKSREAAILHFDLLAKNPRVEKLRNCLKNHFDTSKDKIFVSNFMDLLVAQEQYMKPLLGKSVASTLSALCSDHWHEAKGSKLSPTTLVSSHGVSDKLFDWVAFYSRAKKGCWMDISNFFIVKGWLGTPKLRTELPADYLFKQLVKYSAPPDILEIYIQFIDDVEKRTEAAKKCKLHKIAADGYFTMKDRLGLLDYKSNYLPKLPNLEVSYVDKLLNTPGTRWKN